MEAALDWIVTASAVYNHRGISGGYDSLLKKWKPPYPETTGYTIPTLLHAANRLQRSELRNLALSHADYLLQVCNMDGAVGHWSERSAQPITPIVFDTGQATFGWLAAWGETGNRVYLDAATRAADWLVAVQSPDGPWRQYQHLGLVKVIDTRVALALLELSKVTKSPKYVPAARRNLDWARGQQQSNGWFSLCTLLPGTKPITHTIAYTIEGLLECGLILGDETCISAAQRTADILLSLQRADGSLPGELASNWNGSLWSCLTGNAQMAIVWFRLYEIARDLKYARAALDALRYVKQKQDLSSSNPAVRGAIPGSSPRWGPYERFKYPNWAAKFFVDALMAEEDYATDSALCIDGQESVIPLPRIRVNRC